MLSFIKALHHAICQEEERFCNSHTKGNFSRRISVFLCNTGSMAEKKIEGAEHKYCRTGRKFKAMGARTRIIPPTYTSQHLHIYNTWKVPLSCTLLNMYAQFDIYQDYIC